MLKFLPNEVILEATAVKPLDSITIDVYPHGEEEVWVFRDIWKDIDLLRRVSYEFPVLFPRQSVTSYNPFLKQPVPYEFFDDFQDLVKTHLRVNKNVDVNIKSRNAWANIYQHGKISATGGSIYPHVDDYLDNGSVGLVANIWLHEESKGQATAFWRTRKTNSVTKCQEYDQAIFEYAQANQEVVQFFNYLGDQNLEKVLEVPASYGDVTLYKTSQIHSPVVSYDPEVLRHSWCISMLVEDSSNDYTNN